MSRHRDVLLADADVLVDYAETSLSILRLVSTHLGQVWVLSEILAQANGLSRARCRHNGISIVRAHYEDLYAAGDLSGSLSFEDRLCYLTCKRNSWNCVTNEKRLIRECKNAGITYRRGLRLMSDLVTAGHLDHDKAIRVALKIHEINPHHISDQIIEAFRAALDN